MSTETTGQYDYAILEELRAMNRRLEGIARTAEKVAESLTPVIARVTNAVDDIPKSVSAGVPDDASVFADGQVIDAPASPPVGSIIRDCDGDRWFHGRKGWGVRDWGGTNKFCSVLAYAPLTVLDVGDGNAPR